MKDFFKELAKFHAAEKAEMQEQNAFLWARLVNLVDVVITYNYGDGSGEKYMREEADACLKDLLEKFNEDK